VYLFFNPPGKFTFPSGKRLFSLALTKENTMNKNDRKYFFRFADSATNLELEAKLIQLHNLILKLTETSTIANANWMTKEICLELDARKDIHA
jgi:hypothetical protein